MAFIGLNGLSDIKHVFYEITVYVSSSFQTVSDFPMCVYGAEMLRVRVGVSVELKYDSRNFFQTNCSPFYSFHSSYIILGQNVGNLVAVADM